MLQHLTAALEIANKIESELTNPQWDKIETLISRRDVLLSKAEQSQQPITATDADKIKTVIAELSILNDKLLVTASKEKADLYEKIKESNKSRKMHNAYKQL